MKGDGLVKVKCMNCKKEFTKNRAKCKINPNHFCSRECFFKYPQSKMKKQIYYSPRKIMTCYNCNHDFVILEFTYFKKLREGCKKFFCCRKCYESYQHKPENNSMYGKVHPNKGKKGLWKMPKESVKMTVMKRMCNGSYNKKSTKGKKIEELYGQEKANVIRSKMSNARSNIIIPKKDTSIEVKIQNFLNDLKVEFLTHKFIKLLNHGYQCDILIPSMNLVIECDGDYWHGNPNRFKDEELSALQKTKRQKDIIRTNELIEKGFKVLRLWESDINKMDLESFKEVMEHNVK